MTDTNPLLAKLRQPKFQFDLPSNGTGWPAGSVDSAVGLQVFPFTGQDEMLLLNTNALFLGSVLAEIITNSIPSIKDVWSMPRYDLDAVNLALLAASYGDTISLEYVCPECEHVNTIEVSVADIIKHFKIPSYADPFALDDFTIWFKPVTFRENFQLLTDSNTKERVVKQLRDQNITEEEKQQIINRTLKEVTDINIRSLVYTIDRVSLAGGEPVSDQTMIEEWIKTLSREDFDTVKSKSNSLIESYELPKKNIKCANCEHEYEVDIEVTISEFINQSAKQQ